MKNITKILFIFAVVVVSVFSIAQIANACSYHAYTHCYADRLYWYDSCGNIEDVAQYCSNGCTNNSCNFYNNNNNYNSYHSYQKCVGNGLYWYDSYGNQQDLAQWCQNGCNNNSCQNYNNYNNYNYNYNYPNYSNCTYHAYRLCLGNGIYWYDSCGNQQDLYQNCNYANQTCQYGNCVAQQAVLPTYVAPLAPVVQNTYASHARTACYQNNIYWYDSLNQVNDLYKTCSDENSCTVDTCSSNKCSNNLTCDGSTCQFGSADYDNYCVKANTQNNTQTNIPGSNQGNTTNTNSTSTDQNNIQPTAPNLSVGFFVRTNASQNQWQKNAQVSPNSQVYFMISVSNNSEFSISNVSVLANIPQEVVSLGNVSLNGVPVLGDIVSGINTGSLAPHSSQTISFEGQTQDFTTQADKQAQATASVSSSNQSDIISLTFVPGATGASVTSAAQTPWIIEFLKRWYLWIIVGLVLVFLFIMVFRRLSKA